MSDTWAGVLAISVAVMAVVQVVYLVVLAVAARRLMDVAARTQQQMHTLAADVRVHVGTVTERVNAVADDVRGVTARVQEVATSVADGVHRVEEQVRAAGVRMQETVDQVPTGVKRGVPAGLALLAALRTVQSVRYRMKRDPSGDDDRYPPA